MEEILQKFKIFLIENSELSFIYNGGGKENSVVSIVESEDSTIETTFENLLNQFLEKERNETIN